jgi:hypothetical protein
MEPCNYERILDEETPQAKRIAEYLKGYGVEQVLDVGCGPGNYVAALNDAGINAKGVDVDRRCLQTPECHVTDIIWDEPKFTAPVVLSLEVGEHIPADYSWHYIRYIVKCVPSMVIFSAAQIGQGGDGHINCQPRHYWCSRFEWLGYKYDNVATTDFLNFMRNGYHMGWLANNAMIFHK